MSRQRIGLLLLAACGAVIAVGTGAGASAPDTKAEPHLPTSAAEVGQHDRPESDGAARDDVAVSPAVDARKGIPSIIQSARSELGTSFAGVRHNGGSGAVEVFTTDASRGHDALRRAGADAGVAVEIVEVPRSEATLLEQGQKLFDSLSAEIPGDFSFSADASTGRFSVRVVPNRSVDARRVLNAARDSLDASYVDVVEVADLGGDDCSRTACPPPLRGGIRISPSSGGNCSTGFYAARADGSPVMLSAGHCASSTGRHNGTTVGSTGQRVDSGGVDAQRIAINNPSYWQPTRWVRRDSSWQVVINGVVPWESLYYDQYLCRAGGYTEDCGLLNATIAADNNNYPVVEVWDMCANGGDSGGAVWDPNTGYAAGLHVSSSSGDVCPGGFELSYFSSISMVQSALGVNVVTK